MTPEAIAEGFIDIAVGNMANAIKKISVQRGHDVTEYTLCTFGGAGWPARLPGRRRARHDARLRPSAGRCAVGLRHGARRPDRAEGACDRGDARRRPAARDRGRGRVARDRRGRRIAAAGCGARAHHDGPTRPPALRGHRLGADRRPRRPVGDARGLRGAVPQALLVPDAEPRADRRGDLGRGDRQGRCRRRGGDRTAAARRTARRVASCAHVRRRHVARRRAVRARRAASPAIASTARRSSPRPTPRPSSNRAGAPR